MPQNKLKHILMIAGWFPDEKNPTLGIFVKEHVKSVASFCNASVVTLRIEKTNRLSPKIIITEYAEENYARYDVIVETPFRKFGLHDYLVKRACEKAITHINKNNNIDLMHIHVRTHITKLVTAVDATRHIPIVVSEHWSFYQTGILNLPFEEQKRTIEEVKLWYTNVSIKAILPVSKMLGKIMQERYGVQKNRITKVGNVAAACFDGLSKQKNDEEVNIVLVAMWTHPKNPMLFVDALKQLHPAFEKKINVHWIGIGPQLEEVKKTITGRFEGVSFTFYGLLSKLEIAKIFAQADFLVHPSDSENLPTIIAEALCSGLPVLSNSVGGIPEMIDESNGVLVEANNVNLFSKALLFMLGNYSKYNQQNISTTAKALYSADAIGKQLLIIYNKCIDEK